MALAAVDLGAADSWMPTYEPSAPTSGRDPTFSWLPRAAPMPTGLSDGTVSGFVGQRAIGGTAWRDQPSAFQAGAQLTLGSPSWWVRPIVGYYHATGRGEYHDAGEYDLNLGFAGSYREAESRGTLSVEIDDIALGLGQSWSWRWLHVDGAGGAGWVHASLEDRPAATAFRQFALVDTSPRSDTAQTISWWASVGLSTDLGVTRLGLAARYTYAPVSVLGRDLDAGGMQYGGTVSWWW